MAVTAQFPALKRFKVEPEIEQIVGVVVENNIPAPLDALADKTTDLLDKFILVVGEKVIVCGSRETSNETVYRSDARNEVVASLWYVSVQVPPPTI